MKIVYRAFFRFREGVYKISIIKAKLIRKTEHTAKLEVVEEILSMNATRFKPGERVSSVNPLFDNLLEAKIYVIKRFWER